MRQWEPKKRPDQSASDWAADRMEAAFAHIDALEAALASVVKFAEQAEDPEHHTLDLIKRIAITALPLETVTT